MLRHLTFFALSISSGISLCAQTHSAPDTGGILSDTLKAQVCVYDKAIEKPAGYGSSRQMLWGNTHDLSPLDIRAYTLSPGKSLPLSADSGSVADQLLIVREGSLTISMKDSTKVLGPGGIGLFSSTEKPRLSNAGSAPVTFYRFRFRSSPHPNLHAPQSPVLIDWAEMTMKKTDKGESRQIFSQPVTWLNKIDMHATTLNPGEVSHPPHTHRAEEIILLRSGHVQMHIGDKYYPATAGDLVFLSSGIPHALENRSDQSCEYFALQWVL